MLFNNASAFITAVTACMIAILLPPPIYADEVTVDPDEPVVEDPVEEEPVPELYKTLQELSIPLVTIICENNEEPVCTEVEHPAGCWGSGIIDATKVPSRVLVTLKDEVIFDSGDYVKKESGATVKIRGNTSAYKSKKAFKIKLQKKGDLLGRGDKKYNDKNWVLLRTGSGLNTRVGFWISELIEQDWTPAHTVVNVWMNGKYRGLYILAEGVEVNDKCRINVDEVEGYVIEADPYWWTEDLSFTSNLLDKAMKYTFKYPDPDDITEEQLAYIQNDILTREELLRKGEYTDVFDSESFARWLLAWDILGNSDAGGANMFVVKENNDAKLKMGPIWDFDHAYKGGDDWSSAHNSTIFYFQRLLNASDNTFVYHYVKLWDKYKDTIFNDVIDRVEALRNSQEGEDYNKSLTLESENGIPLEDKSYIDAMKGDLHYMSDYMNNWFTDRKPWIENNIGDLRMIATGVEEVSILEENDGLYYDIMGRVVDRNTKGILIHNGKKIIVK